MEFTYRSFPNRIYFGKGKRTILPELLKDYHKVLVLATGRLDGEVKKLQDALGADRVVHFSKIIQHVPETLVAEAKEFRSIHQPEVVVAIGGGSAIGLAKALALDQYIPQIAIPSTYSGSEQTNIFGISTEVGKTTGRNDQVLPGVVIYDSELTVGMPKLLAATSAMNAMAHLMEAIYSPTANPVTRSIALQGMEVIKKGMENLAQSDSLTEESNENLLLGAYLAGKCLCEVEMSLHHKACHTLGGSFGLDHASVHTVMQSYILDFQWDFLSEEMKNDFKNVFQSENPALELRRLAGNCWAKTDLQSLGFGEENIPKAVELMLAKPYANVRPLTQENLSELLRKAVLGELG